MIKHLLAWGSAATPVRSSSSRLAPEASDTGPRKIGAPLKAPCPERGTEPGHKEGQKKLRRPRLLCREEDCLAFASDLLCNLKQVSCPLWVSVSSPVAWV